jgi:hypothetical protein
VFGVSSRFVLWLPYDLAAGMKRGAPNPPGMQGAGESEAGDALELPLNLASRSGVIPEHWPIRAALI